MKTRTRFLLASISALWLGLLCPNLPAAPAAPIARIPVILSTDIGDDIDDTWALALALRCPEFDLKLVVGDYGNPQPRARLLAKFLEAAGRTEIPVGAAWDITITPLDTCGFVQLRSDKYARVRDNADPMLRGLMENYRVWTDWNLAHNKKGADPAKASSILFDCVAVYLAITHDLCVMEPLRLRVDDEGFTREDPAARQMRVATQWKDLPAFEDWMVQRLTEKPKGTAQSPAEPKRDTALARTILADTGSAGRTATFSYAPAPADNPLKGFVPYLRADSTFPHSLEWDYTKLSDVMTGPTDFHWAPFDAKLNAAASRGHQFFARFYLEWPGKKTGVPQYLIDAGLTMRRWTNTNTQPFPPAVDHTPDYEDPRLRAALTNFIHALGRRYDGDPRLGFVGLGLLGTWGEWHNSPNDRWFASKTVQREVMDAYEAAFKKTKLVARYPAGTNDYRYADNGARAIGYHDDSFAWATVHTGKRDDGWFFETRLRSAGALDKWRMQPIGGEVRPEVWKCLFDDPSCAPQGQEFDRCVAVTHASWLCNEGVFRGQIKGAARERAIKAVRRMGYELHVASAEISPLSSGSLLPIALTVTNTGVAPFYYDWPVELGVLNSEKKIMATWKPDWKLSAIVPGNPAKVWRFSGDVKPLAPDTYQLLLRVANPLPRGAPLRFANQSQDQHMPGWLTLLKFQR